MHSHNILDMLVDTATVTTFCFYQFGLVVGLIFLSRSLRMLAGALSLHAYCTKLNRDQPVTSPWSCASPLVPLSEATTMAVLTCPKPRMYTKETPYLPTMAASAALRTDLVSIGCLQLDPPPSR